MEVFQCQMLVHIDDQNKDILILGKGPTNVLHWRKKIFYKVP